MKDQYKHISKLMSLVLRHKPEEIGLSLDENGWARVAELIEKINAKGISFNIEMLTELVAANDKQRFAFNDDKTMIRASQGHSVTIELGLVPVIPPDILYHGTTEKYVDSILTTGIQKQRRQHVHLSATIETANTVGSRHGKPVILTVLTKEMHEAGLLFYLSENKVWLTDAVPAAYIKLKE